MLESISWDNVIAVGSLVLPYLFILIWVAKAFIPKSDEYFATAYVTLQEVDDFIDMVKAKFPELPHINTVDDVVNELIKQLEKAGYKKITPTGKEKMANRVLGSFSREEGFDVTFNKEDNKLDGATITYNKKL